MGLFRAFCRQTLTTLPVLLLSFVYGLKVGYTQSATPIFKSRDAPFTVSEDEISWMGSISYTGTLLSVIICYFFGNKMGRKSFIAGSVLTYFIIWITFLFTSSSVIIIIGLGFYGISASMHAIMGYIYIGEVASPQNREFLGISYWLMMLVGIGLEFLIASMFQNYRLLIIFPLVCIIGVGILLLFMRESPYYLLSKGKTDQAVKIQAWLMDETEDQVRATDLDSMSKYALSQEEGRGNFKDMFEPTNLKILGLMVWLNGTIMVNSGNVAQQYGQKVMERFEKFMDLNIFVHIFNVVSFVGAITSFITIKFIGRQVLLIVGYSLVVTSHLMIALCHYIERLNNYGIRDLAYVIGGLHCFTWFLAAATIIGGLSVLKSEIFPAKLKEFFNAILAFSGDAIGFAVVKTYAFLVDSIGDEWVLMLYAILNLLGLLLVFIAMRETKNKTLYEIQTEYKDQKGK